MGNLMSAGRVRYEELRSLAFSSISDTNFTAVGTPFANPVRLIKVTNLTDADLYISLNGIDRRDVVAAGGYYVYDYGSNKSDVAGFLEQAAGERIYVQAISDLPTKKSIYITTIYASQA